MVEKHWHCEECGLVISTDEWYKQFGCILCGEHINLPRDEDNAKDAGAVTLAVFGDELVGLANSLLDIANDPELEGACHYSYRVIPEGRGVAVMRIGEGRYHSGTRMVYRLRRQSDPGKELQEDSE